MSESAPSFERAKALDDCLFRINLQSDLSILKDMMTEEGNDKEYVII